MARVLAATTYSLWSLSFLSRYCTGGLGYRRSSDLYNLWDDFNVWNLYETVFNYDWAGTRLSSWRRGHLVPSHGTGQCLDCYSYTGRKYRFHLPHRERHACNWHGWNVWRRNRQFSPSYRLPAGINQRLCFCNSR